MKGLLFLMVCLGCLVAFADAAVPGMTDQEAYNQLVHFFEMTNMHPSPQNKALVEAVEASEMWQTLHAQFGAKK